MKKLFCGYSFLIVFLKQKISVIFQQSLSPKSEAKTGLKVRVKIKNATMEFSYFLHIDVLNAPPSEYAKIFLDYQISF